MVRFPFLSWYWDTGTVQYCRLASCPGTRVQAADRHSTIQQVSHPVLVLRHRQQTGTVQYSRFPFLPWYWDTDNRQAQYNKACFPSCPGTGTQTTDRHRDSTAVFPFGHCTWDTGNRQAQRQYHRFPTLSWDMGHRQQTGTETEQQVSHSVMGHGTQARDRHRDNTADVPFYHGIWDKGNRQAQRQYSRFPILSWCWDTGNRQAQRQYSRCPILSWYMGQRQQTGTKTEQLFRFPFRPATGTHAPKLS